MYAVSQTFINKVKEASRTINAEVLVNTTKLTTNEIQEFSIDYSMGEIPGIGNIVSTKLNLKLLRTGNTPSYYTTQTIKPSVAIDDGVGNWMWVPLGTFYPQPDSIKRTDYVIELECFDILTTLDTIVYQSSLSYPTSIRNVANEIATKYNCPLKDVNQLPAVNMKVKPEGQSVRAVLAEIAEMASANAVMDRNGKLTFIKPTTVNFSMNADNYINFTLESDTDVKITKLICEKGGEDGEGNEIADLEYGDTTGATLRFQNDSVSTQAELKTIYDRIYPMTYTAYELNCQGMPHLEVGDKITLTDRKNVVYTLPITTHTLSFNGSILSTLGAKAPSTNNSTGSTGSNSISQAIDKVMANTITVNNILAGNITADNIAANAITADKIAAGAITAEKIVASVIEAINLNAGSAVIDSALIDVAEITTLVAQDIMVGTAQIKDLAVTVAKIQEAFVDSLVATQGKFESAHIGELTSDNIAAGAITTGKLDAGAVTAGTIAAGAVTTDTLAANSITSEKIAAGTIVADDIAANAITTEKINAGAVTAGKISAGAITADKIGAGEITAGKLAANSVVAGNISAGAITTDKIGANQVTAGKIAAGAITADKIEAGAVEAEKISADAVNAIAVNAGSIVANDITTGAIKISNANILDGTINGAKITSATITNAQIKDATIDSAKIANLNAGKITAGTLDTTKVSINSTSGKLTIQDNTIQIKDNQTTPKVRVQIGKDATNNYGIIVTNAAGAAIFDSDKGVLIPEGLNSNVVSTDKIVDEAVSPSKIQIQELWADTAYVNEFNGKEINADNITTGTISGERINIKGLINFEALDEDLSKLYVPGAGNGTVINGGFIGADTIKASSIDLYSGLTVLGQDGTPSFAIAANGDVEVNGLLQSGNYIPGSSGYQVRTDGRAEFNQAIIRGSIDLPYAGLTNEGGTDKSVRIWAGASYQNREAAPFQVLQDGTVLATDGTFSGRVYGNYDNDKIHIHDNEIVIDSTSTYLNKSGQEQSISPLGTPGDEPYVRLGAGQSLLNTDVIFGSNNDKRIEYLNEDRQLNLTNMNISMNGSMANVSFDRASGAFGGLNIAGPTGGLVVLRGSTSNDKLGTLVFDSEGNQGARGDFSFTRKNYAGEGCKVDIDGALVVKDTISSTKQNIEMRSVASSDDVEKGWGFYAT